MPIPPAQTGEPTSSYDEVPYASHPYRKSHPDNLAVLARLFGMTPAPVPRCRVLELGCAAGGNLIPMAQGLPESRFIGVDLSQRQVAEGQAVIAALGLTNIELQHRDLLDLDAGDGSFDYILCHGVYSWVPTAVQRKILAVCREHLQPQGVAYVSYNTYPGWHLRGMVREMMNYHAAGFQDPADRIGQSRALLDFLIEATPLEGRTYDLLLRDELQLLRRASDSYLFHEHLEVCNEPLYFHQFVARAEQAGLRYLAEAWFSAMVPNSLALTARETLHKIAPDLIHMEQYLDFLRNRMFRCTLLCHQEVIPTRTLGPETVRNFYISSPLAADGEPDHLFAPQPRTFQHPDGGQITIPWAFSKAALSYLGTIWPQTVVFDQLLERSRQQLEIARVPRQADAPADEAQALGKLILDGYAADLIELSTLPSVCSIAFRDRPRTCPLARLQADGGSVVTNLRHDRISVSAIERQTLRLLDGTRDRAVLGEMLTEAVLRGDLQLESQGQVLRSRSEIREALVPTLDAVLTGLARRAFLIG